MENENINHIFVHAFTFDLNLNNHYSIDTQYGQRINKTNSYYNRIMLDSSPIHVTVPTVGVLNLNNNC